MDILIQLSTVLISTIAAGVLGRMGGAAGYDTKWRDAGVPAVVCIEVGILGGFHWTLILAFGLMWGTMTTYFKKKGDPVRWYNWLICGLAYSVAMIPYVWAQGLWTGFGLRCLVLPPLIMVWCVLIGNAVWEEFWRYALIALTAALLFIKRKNK